MESRSKTTEIKAQRLECTKVYEEEKKEDQVREGREEKKREEREKQVTRAI